VIKYTRLKPQAKHRSRRLRLEPSDAEQILWQCLRNRQVGNFKFRRQHPLGRYVLDFVCLEAKLVIKLDGGQHLDRADYDQKRTRWLEQKGFHVLRFWNHDVINNREDVLDVIWRALRLDIPPPPQSSP